MITPYICVADGRAAIDWYCQVLGGKVTFDPIVMDDGRIGHAEVTLGDDGRMMLSESFPDYGVEPPDPARGNPVSLHLSVADVASACAGCRRHDRSGPADR